MQAFEGRFALSLEFSSASHIAAKVQALYGIDRHAISGEHLIGLMPPLNSVFSRPPASPLESAPSATADPQVNTEPVTNTSAAWGVILETRQHPALAFVIRNVVEQGRVPVQVFHGRANESYLHASGLDDLIETGRVLLTKLDLPERISQAQYNGLMLSPGLWHLMAGRGKILVFQTDALCCPESDYALNDFLHFDYIGSRWSRERPVGLLIDGGSGGFSLRDWSLSTTCLQRFPPERWPGGEDGYYAFFMDLLGARVASMREAATFSTQDEFTARSFGCHQIDRLPAAQLEAFLNYCPSARQLVSPSTHLARLPPDTVAEAVPARNPMFISHTHRLIFFEVPRTGSNSITHALSTIDPESPTVAEREKHGGGAGYHHLDDALLQEPAYRLIAAHRNPFDRLWSFWKHRKQNGNPDTFRTLSWADYIAWVCDPDSTVTVPGALPDIPITEMLDPSRVDLWLDCHRMEESRGRAVSELGLPPTPLAVLNRSPNHGPMQAAYNARNAGPVIERFASDFDTFGYSRDSWRQGAALHADDGGSLA